MTKVKSISIEGSSPTPIVDKGIDEAQTRSTVSVTDVVKVQDGNGIWHAIPFNKFMEVATPLVASIMNNVNLQGNIKKFLGLDANGNPGVSTIADAASVLGVTRSNIRDITFSNTGTALANIDDAPYGIAKYIDGTLNAPSSAGTVFTLELYSGRKAQLAFGHTGQLCYRYRNASNVWQSWITIHAAY